MNFPLPRRMNNYNNPDLLGGVQAGPITDAENAPIFSLEEKNSKNMKEDLRAVLSDVQKAMARATFTSNQMNIYLEQLSECYSRLDNILNQEEEERDEPSMESYNKLLSVLRLREDAANDIRNKSLGVLKIVQNSCSHPKTGRTRGSSGPYGYEDRETICLHCNKILN